MNLARLRREYGNVYITTFPDGQMFPWKQLTIGEFLDYTEMFQNQKYARASIENEIFKKCIVDELLIERMDRFPAGTVFSVVNDILKNSGPETIPELNYGLALSRMKASEAVHETVSLIAQAFPAYKLEDIYNFEYPVFLLRLAQAEAKLLRLGILMEPVIFEEPVTKEMQEMQESQAEEKPHIRPDISAIADRIEESRRRPQSNSKTIISASDITGSESTLLGHEKEDQVLLRQEMVEEAGSIYSEYITQMNKGQDIDIKSPTERLEAADKRAALNKAAFDSAVKQKQASEKQLLENIAKARERKAAKNK